MGMLLIDFFRSKLGAEPSLRKSDKKAVKHWVKNRLAHLFPELRNDPEAIEELYQALDLEARPGCGKGGTTAFELIFPEKHL